MPVHVRPFLTLPLALITLLVLRSEPASAEWVGIGDNNAGMTVYVNPDTIRRKGDLVKMWSLYDYKNIEMIAGRSSLSTRIQYELDCAEERFRLHAYARFSGNMGSGTVVYSDPNISNWEPVAPQSFGLLL